MQTKKLFILTLLTLWLSLFAVPQRAQGQTLSHSRRPQRITHQRRAAVRRSIRVSVNPKTGVYHYPGQRWYGQTKYVEFMTEAEAKVQRYRATLNGQ